MTAITVVGVKFVCQKSLQFKAGESELELESELGVVQKLRNAFGVKGPPGICDMALHLVVGVRSNRNVTLRKNVNSAKYKIFATKHHQKLIERRYTWAVHLLGWY